MATPGHQVDALSAIVANPLLRGVTALIAVSGAIVRYINESGDRLAHAKAVSERYDLKGPIFWTINRFPHILHRIVAYSILAVAVLQLAFLAGEYFVPNSGILLWPSVKRVMDFLTRYFFWMFLIAFLFYGLFELRVVEKFLAWVVGSFSVFRNTLGWANAQWQIARNPADPDERRILAPLDSQIEIAASKLIDELVVTPRNKNLALRPTNLTQDSAANVLYFGHVIEQYLSANSASSQWTAFYQALAEVAGAAGFPLSPKRIMEFDTQTPFLTVLLQANAHISDLKDQIPNNAAIEDAVETAFNTLRAKYKSDARNIGAGCARGTYRRVLRRSVSFLKTEGMRRQFAKLFILWNILPLAGRPKVFRIPFNTKMFLHYLDLGLIRANGDHFNINSEPVQICFEVIQNRIVERVLTLLDKTKDASRVQWRDKEMSDVQSRNIDWPWWVYYRADQQAYHDARGYKSTKWYVEGNDVVSS